MGTVRNYSPHRPWTKEEEQKLIELSEYKTQSGIAKELGRSVQSVKCKRSRMGIDSYINQTDRLTMSDVSRLVGIDLKSISTTWRKYGLRFRRNGPFMTIGEDSLVKFMQDNPNLWKASKCDYYFFCRYKWFKKRLEDEKAGIDTGDHYQNKRSWSDYDISRFKMLKKKGYSHREIAEELGRTKLAIDHLSIRLNRSASNAI